MRVQVDRGWPSSLARRARSRSTVASQGDWGAVAVPNVRASNVWVQRALELCADSKTSSENVCLSTPCRSIQRNDTGDHQRDELEDGVSGEDDEEAEEESKLESKSLRFPISRDDEHGRADDGDEGDACSWAEARPAFSTPGPLFAIDGDGEDEMSCVMGEGNLKVYVVVNIAGRE